MILVAIFANVFIYSIYITNAFKWSTFSKPNAKGEFALSNFHPQNRQAPTMLCTCLGLLGGVAITWTHPIYCNDAPQWSD